MNIRKNDMVICGVNENKEEVHLQQVSALLLYFRFTVAAGGGICPDF